MFNKEIYKKIFSEIPEHVKIVAATKTKSVDDIREAINSGIEIIGENYVQEAEEKYNKLKDFFENNNISFHLIGHLQSKKTKKAVKIFNCIESVDSQKIADKIDKVSKELGKKIEVMIEINFGEEQKSGIPFPQADSLIEHVKKLQNIKLIGLMTIPPIGQEEYCFKKMKILAEKHYLKELSMGMSSDYKIAIENGATIIRLGTLLFGKRNLNLDKKH